MKRIALWLDDTRDPFSFSWRETAEKRAAGGEIQWVTSCDDFVDAYTHIFTDGDAQLVAVMLDYDLSTTDTSGDNGYDAAKLLVKDAIEYDVEAFAVSCHSSSSEGREVIEQELAKLTARWAAT